MVQPVYNFLGYSINEIKITNEHKENTYVGISIPHDYFDAKTKMYSIFIRISTDFSDDESYIIFQGGFQINDLKWYDSLEENIRKSIFFAILFPFVREKVYSITSDSNPGLFIPTINVKEIDFSKELRLIKTTQSN